MAVVDVTHDQMPSACGPLNVEPQPIQLTMSFEATSQLLGISRRMVDLVCVSFRLFLYKGTNVTM
jgi:hypothetical protein